MSRAVVALAYVEQSRPEGAIELVALGVQRYPARDDGPADREDVGPGVDHQDAIVWSLDRDREQGLNGSGRAEAEAVTTANATRGNFPDVGNVASDSSAAVAYRLAPESRCTKGLKARASSWFSTA